MTAKLSGVFLFYTLLLGACFSTHVVAEEVPAETTVGELTLSTLEGSTVPALLLSTNISADVNGLISTIIIEQRFKNTSEDWVNGRYVFPLPESAAVDGMKMKIGERIIEGQIKEKAAAKKAFVEAKQAGKKASLLQQHRPNMFSMSVANIPPQTEVVTQLRLIDHVKYDSNRFSLRLPTTITPRYIPGAPLNVDLEKTKDVQIDELTGWGINTTVVPDASDITPPQTHAKDNQATNHFSLQLNLNAGIDLAAVYSNSHEISLGQEGVSKQTTIQLKHNTEPMDRDLVVYWEAVRSQTPTAAVFQQQIQGEQYLMAMLLPPTANVHVNIPREITFIVDSSGSMAGESIISAKQSLMFALNQLSPSDKFNIIDFDDNYQLLFNQPEVADQENITKAMHMVQRLQAGGGTEMYRPLEHALTSSNDPRYLKQIVFITDGAVGNSEQLFKLISQRLGLARLFTVGIGSAPNSHFMSRSAKFGKGTFTYIANQSQATEKMRALFTKLNRPIARDIQVAYKHTNASTKSLSKEKIEQFPQKIPDLYANEPLILLTKTNKPIQEIEISGDLAGNPWQRKLTIQNRQSAHTENIDALWARAKVAQLMDGLYTDNLDEKDIRPEIIKLGIKHHLMTKFTSFVAVEKQPSRPINAIAKNKNVANLMPKGSTMVAPQTSTFTSIYALLGAMLLLFSWLSRCRGLRNTLNNKQPIQGD